MLEDYNYMRALWLFFIERGAEDNESQKLHDALGEQLGTEERRMLLRLVDCKNLYTEEVSFESFVAGFRLATGIAAELVVNGNNRYGLKGSSIVSTMIDNETKAILKL